MDKQNIGIVAKQNITFFERNYWFCTLPAYCFLLLPLNLRFYGDHLSLGERFYRVSHKFGCHWLTTTLIRLVLMSKLFRQYRNFYLFNISLIWNVCRSYSIEKKTVFAVVEIFLFCWGHSFFNQKTCFPGLKDTSHSLEGKRNRRSAKIKFWLQNKRTLHQKVIWWHFETLGTFWIQVQFLKVKIY